VREISQETEETEKTGDREFPREFPTIRDPYAHNPLMVRAIHVLQEKTKQQFYLTPWPISIL
jgi:hypothetical protein